MFSCGTRRGRWPTYSHEEKSRDEVAGTSMACHALSFLSALAPRRNFADALGLTADLLVGLNGIPGENAHPHAARHAALATS